MLISILMDVRSSSAPTQPWRTNNDSVLLSTRYGLQNYVMLLPLVKTALREPETRLSSLHRRHRWLSRSCRLILEMELGIVTHLVPILCAHPDYLTILGLRLFSQARGIWIRRQLVRDPRRGRPAAESHAGLPARPPD